ncbi:MAG: hypothetical protein RLZZ470_1725 [Pseudomonadota bacterium]|jgi:tetraacyldisaccharide 4'-kinase
MRSGASVLQKAWLSRGWLACLLWPTTLLSRLWLFAVWLVYALRLKRPTKLPVPVLVVGNVLVGGTGKTPIVMHLAAELKAMGWQVGVIARAQETAQQNVQEVHPHSPAMQVGDEPLLVKKRSKVPVFIGQQRAKAAQALLKAYPNTQLIISDDGLQHRALHHDLAICVFDDRGLGNGFLLPAGPLRETWPRKPKVPQFIVHTGEKPLGDSHSAQRRLADMAVNGMGQTRPLASWQGETVQALAAIAQPEVFFQALRDHGINLSAAHSLPDHAPLTVWQCPDDQDLFCTEKDAVKLWLRQPQTWAVPLVCTLPQALWDALLVQLNALSSKHGQKTA